jgi:hypothetical protein
LVPRYPESEKLRDNEAARDTIIEFVQWLGQHGYWVGERVEMSPDRGFLLATGKNPDTLAMEFLGIDQAKLEVERRTMLEALHG